MCKSINTSIRFMVTELWGVLEGLKHAKRLNFRVVELNIDSLAVVQTISEAGRGSHRGSVLVHMIRQLLEMEWEVVVHHTYRETNKCADALANIGCSLRYYSIFYDTCPSQLSSLLLDDMLGITTPRLAIINDTVLSTQPLDHTKGITPQLHMTELQPQSKTQTF
ncbi:putative non-LTR retroelement reverse transcriptase [Trifolium medium]|uniref:Putative non-LTR retroelement reverse transcriptase n=1 Tax=Trifolium medium TaxID=97028 RepID=A0A392M8F6_9FABA|nr:putative non-LTR retroelement reverse transcriptase [Trifolium medium]